MRLRASSSADLRWPRGSASMIAPMRSIEASTSSGVSGGLSSRSIGAPSSVVLTTGSFPPGGVVIPRDGALVMPRRGACDAADSSCHAIQNVADEAGKLCRRERLRDEPLLHLDDPASNDF